MVQSHGGWASSQYCDSDKLSRFAWLLGYFHETHEGWDGRRWRRNFEELRGRDLAVFALGAVAGKRGLDLGGGDGTYSLVLSALGADMAVQDLSSEAIATGRGLAQATGLPIEFVVGDARQLQFPDQSFDFVFSADVFEHLDYGTKDAVFAEMYRVLKPGGLLVIKTPNLDYLRLSIWVRRLRNLVRGRSPFIYIAHTRNNPDCEHHGLTTFRELAGLCDSHFFHEPRFVPQPLHRPGMPRWLGRWLKRIHRLAPNVIMAARKSVFVAMEQHPTFSDNHTMRRPDATAVSAT